MRLKNKVAVITGGSSGIGRAIALLFAEHGAKTAVFDIQQQSRLEEERPDVISAIRETGGSGDYYQVDVTDLEQVNSSVDAVLAKWGQIDILVNNAGIFIRNPITEVSDEEWDKVMNINLRGYFYTCRKVLPAMTARKSGKIINLSSIHGLVGTGTATTYCASKGAIDNLTRQLAVDYSQHGINVNAINPGTIITAMSKPFRENPAILQEYLTQTLLPRLGNPEDVANAALFLASSESDFITGHCLVVDGGWTAW